MKRTIAVICCMLTFACLMMVGCKSNDTVAATVNGQDIMESEVTDSVNQIRAQYGITEDADFAAFLESNGTNPSEFRASAIRGIAQKMLLEKAATDAGIVIDDATLDSYIEAAKANYASESDFEENLKAYGYTEESYRESYKMTLIAREFKGTVLEFDRPTDDDVAAVVSENASNYKGKRSSHILFAKDDKVTAEKVLERLKNGEDFAELALEFSTDGSAQSGGDVGWSCMHTFVEPYQSALDGLSLGEMTQGLVESEYGYHIIKCTGIFDYPNGTKLEADDIPEEIYQNVYESLLNDAANIAFNNYLIQLLDDADIVINDMPAGLPYDVAGPGTANAGAAEDPAAE